MPGVHLKEAEKDPDQHQDDAEGQGRADDDEQRDHDVGGADEGLQGIEKNDADEERQIEATRRRDDAADRRQVPLSGEDDDPAGLRVQHLGEPGENRANDQEQDQDVDQDLDEAGAGEHRRLVYGLLISAA